MARLGPRDASRVLITISATHGAEGFCGSGAQVGSFEVGLGRELPADTALVAIHAINPYGFAWLRRVTEDNVDLNRNFVDHSAPLPRNPGYDELADAICPSEWQDAARDAARRRLEAYGSQSMEWRRSSSPSRQGNTITPTASSTAASGRPGRARFCSVPSPSTRRMRGGWR